MKKLIILACGAVLCVAVFAGWPWNSTDSYLTLPAGTTTVAPLKFTSGPLLTVVTPGTMEYLDHTFYLTTFLVRRSVQLNQNIVVTPVTVSNTVTETTATILSIGAGGTLTASARLVQDSTVNMDALAAPVSIDTTTTNTFIITCEWSAAGANSLQLNQGFTECVQ
jgi:hypothetical protein